MTLAQLAELPFVNVFITFSMDPEIVVLQEGAGLMMNVTATVCSQVGSRRQVGGRNLFLKKMGFACLELEGRRRIEERG
jgi:hypothetical protein